MHSILYLGIYLLHGRMTLVKIEFLKWGFLNDYYKMNPIGQCKGKNLVNVMAFAHCLQARSYGLNRI